MKHDKIARLEAAQQPSTDPERAARVQAECAACTPR
jgi:hypothetical protein